MTCEACRGFECLPVDDWSTPDVDGIPDEYLGCPGYTDAGEFVCPLAGTEYCEQECRRDD